MKVAVIILALFVILYLLFVYNFYKKNYNNFLVSFFLDKQVVENLKSKRIDLINYKKISTEIKIQTIFLIIFLILYTMALKINNKDITFLVNISFILISLFLNRKTS